MRSLPSTSCPSSLRLEVTVPLSLDHDIRPREEEWEITLMQAGFTEVMDTETMFAKYFAEFQANRLLPPA
jgi:hypothetical protein